VEVLLPGSVAYKGPYSKFEETEERSLYHVSHRVHCQQGLPIFICIGPLQTKDDQNSKKQYFWFYGSTWLFHEVFPAIYPLDYPHLLDYAAERMLLRKVGGSSIFIHRLFLEYFASLWERERETEKGYTKRLVDHGESSLSEVPA